MPSPRRLATILAGLCAVLPLAAALPAAALPAAAAVASPIVINEVESNGDATDWVELKNTGTTDVDLTGWSLLDDDDAHAHVPLPAGSVIRAGGYFVIDQSLFGFGLGAPDAARLYDAANTLVASYAWTAHAATTYGRCPDGVGELTTTRASTRGAANDCGASVVINEVESNGDATDWIELMNTGTAPVDLSGDILRDDTDSHAFVIPAGTLIPAGGYYTADVSASFGLGAPDAARLLAPDGTTLLDAYSWTAHAATTYGRCPNGTGAFTTTSAPTKSAANACAGSETPTLSPWPGGSEVRTADDANVLGGNLSGLYYEPSGTGAPGILWAVKNGPSTLYRLVWNGTVWTPDTANGWGAGKALRYPAGTGDPDAEGVTITGAGPSGGVYVSTERDNANGSVSRPAVLRFDPAQSGTTLTATNDWNLTADLPTVGANLGLEAITWVPDTYLTAKGFVDQTTGSAYDPARYPGHGDGLFLTGLEANGRVYAFALTPSGGHTLVATIPTGMPGVMDLQYDQERAVVWAVCDDTCHGQHELLTIDGTGAFAVSNAFARPTGMPDYNNEGFAVAPQALCVDGLKPAYWADDTNDGGHALRAGTVACAVGSGGGGASPGGDPGTSKPPVDPAAAVTLSATTVVAGGSITATGTGFAAGEKVQAWAHSTPVLLATATADASGAVTLRARIPADLEPGAHTLELRGLTSGRSASAALTVTAAGELAATGSTVAGPAGIALALAAGGMLLLLRRRGRLHDAR